MANIEAYKAEIRRSFDLVKPISQEAASIFYPTLWEVDPSTKELFKDTEMDSQGAKLMKTLGIAVSSLDKMDRLVPVLQNLGKRHVSYGVTAAMYPSVGQALLLTLEKGLGEDNFTLRTKAAWEWVFGVISGVCIEAAKEVDPSYGDAPTTTALCPETEHSAETTEEEEKSEEVTMDVEACKAEIRRTFALVKPISTEAASIFYPTLWEVDPSTKELFSETDIDKQGAKLMKTLGIAVGSLDKMDKLVPVLQNLGKRHVSYGVTAVMYPSVGQALLLTFEKCLGEECTPETKEAWAWVFGVISGVCIEAAKEVDPSY